MIKSSTIDLLINPYNHQSLKLEGNSLVDQSGNIIPIIDGIPDFLVLEKTDGLNKKYREFYDRISKISDIAEFVYSLFMNLEQFRSEWMKDVEIKGGYKVLETSIGTGFNVKVLPARATYFGLDISRGMLKQCQKNSVKWNREIELFHGNAEYMPFKSETFDSVFHVGGINFFNDRKRAIDEMIRVTKPNTKIVIIDETEKRVAKQYRKTPFVKNYFNKTDIDADRLIAPVDIVPVEMKEIEVKLLDQNKMYQLSFRKP